MLESKTVDLEDRSRRCNLVFYNFTEAPPNVTENCERMVLNLLNALQIFDGEETVWIERAHRLGRRMPGNVKPRPVIVCFSYYKQKQEIIKNGAQFKNSTINVSEDFSRETLEEHKKLCTYGANAKQTYTNDMKAIKHYKVTYRHLVLTYSVNKSDTNTATFVRSFTLRDITQNPGNWFIPRDTHTAEN